MDILSTRTLTHTVIDIKKTFESFDADLRMIALRTGKWTSEFVDDVIHDIVKLAEAKYLDTIDVILVDTTQKVIRATKYTVNESGTTITGEKAGGNDWTNIPNTELSVLLSYRQGWKSLTEEQRNNFRQTNNFKVGWSNTNIDNSFPHLTKLNAQLYASNGFELQKTIYK